jgi:hypothetical protein
LLRVVALRQIFDVLGRRRLRAAARLHVEPYAEQLAELGAQLGRDLVGDPEILSTKTVYVQFSISGAFISRIRPRHVQFAGKRPIRVMA